MCGIAGFFQAGRFADEAAKHIALGMAQAVACRGPDDAGAWSDGKSGIALAHRRLAIIDLSPAGHQPMVAHSGRYVLTFNGEIYNHRELRRTLDRQLSVPIPWRGASDTETLLTCIDHLGLKETLQSITGMFAFGLWDRRDGVLHLVVDRLGEKPLYYGWQNRTFLFGSDPSTLEHHPHFTGAVDRDALTIFLRYAYIPAPWSIWQGIRKLPPGTRLSIPLREDTGNGAMPKPAPYWSIKCVALDAAPDQRASMRDDEAVAVLHDLLFRAVGEQMQADVPVGAFLSGGIDSSIIVALMQAQSERPVHTFTIGFGEQAYNEAGYARAIAHHLGTEHTDMHISAGDALDVLPSLPSLYAEPFADASQIPTFLLAKLARRNVAVCLSGDGADELFGGYGRYTSKRLMAYRALSAMPSALRRLASRTGGRALLLLQMISRFGYSSPPARRLDNILHHTLTACYDAIVSVWKQSIVIADQQTAPPTDAAIFPRWLDAVDAKSRMMVLDLLTYLPGDILAKVDRAAMGVGLETRMPFLNHQVVEWALRLPPAFKIRRGKKKWILRKVGREYLPAGFDRRPKMGFSVPLDAWLREDLRDWVEALLDEVRLHREGFLAPRLVREMWADHLSGRRDLSRQIWTVLMFQSWLEEHSSGKGGMLAASDGLNSMNHA